MRPESFFGVLGQLGGFMGGSLAHRLEHALPGPLQELVRGPCRALGPLAGLTPQAVREGWGLAMAKEGKDQPPVLMVPGYLGPSFLLYPLATFLRAHGRRVDILRTFPALDGIEPLARRVARGVARLREETGAPRVDLVAHSMGGLACRYYMGHLMTPEVDVRCFVSIATPHAGTNWAHLPGVRAADMRPGSPLLAELAELTPAPGVRCYNIRAGWDQIVWPREHGRWEALDHDHELPWAEHWAVQLDPRTLALVLSLLEDDPPEGLGDLQGEDPEEASAGSSPVVAPEGTSAGAPEPPPRGSRPPEPPRAARPPAS